MLRSVFLFALLSTLIAFSAAEVIVQDDPAIYGNSVTLPMQDGTATGGYTFTPQFVSPSPYNLYVFINDGPNENESFWIAPTFGDATLVASSFAAGPEDGPYGTPVAAPSPFTSYLGTLASPNTAAGRYNYTFIIPAFKFLRFNLTYNNTGTRHTIDQIFIQVGQKAPVVVGDPQFVGLRGQSFQVHGIDGAIYNLVSEAQSQVNARFDFLSAGECPILDGVADTNCWSHPGSYLGEMSFQQVVDGKLHKALITSGSAKNGFASIIVDDKQLSVGESATFGAFSVSYVSTHNVKIQMTSFSFDLSNSDKFINQRVVPMVPLSKLTSHGLLGQTHVSKIYPSQIKYIDGDVNDYVIGDDDIFGNDFVFNKFQL